MKENPTIKEKSLQPVEAAVHSAPAKKAADTNEEIDERILQAAHAASDKKALDLVLIDLREIATFTDYFLITSGSNQRQVQAIADEVIEKLKKSGSPAARVEGYRNAEWVLVDYGDFVVHVFEEKARRFYDLERLWREGKRVQLPSEFDNQPSSLRNEL